MAINVYLARHYGQHLIPETDGGEARILQWSIWGISEIEPLQMQIVIQQFFTPEGQRDADVIERATKGLSRPLNVLNETLSTQAYLLGDDFTLADLNLSGVMDLLKMLAFDFSNWPAVKAWLAACYGRESYARAKSVGA